MVHIGLPLLGEVPAHAGSAIGHRLLHGHGPTNQYGHEELAMHELFWGMSPPCILTDVNPMVT
jgi:hypothetical protein